MSGKRKIKSAVQKLEQKQTSRTARRSHLPPENLQASAHVCEPRDASFHATAFALSSAPKAAPQALRSHRQQQFVAVFFVLLSEGTYRRHSNRSRTTALRRGNTRKPHCGFSEPTRFVTPFVPQHRYGCPVFSSGYSASHVIRQTLQKGNAD